MLIALLAIMILGGPIGLIGDIKETRKDIKAVIEKSQERDTALVTLKQMEKLTKRRDKNFKMVRKQILASISDHGYSPNDLDQLWDEYKGTRSNFDREFVELRFELKEHISREDWVKIFSRD